MRIKLFFISLLFIFSTSMAADPPKYEASGLSDKKIAETSYLSNISNIEVKTAIPLMAKNDLNGTILNISSVVGDFPAPGFSAYGTAKSALSFLTRELAQELAPRIRVNAIAVGSTKTSSLDAVLTPEIEDTMVSLTPLERLGEVEDVALGALYLCSPASDYVTGEILGVNGGLERLSMELPRAFGDVC